MKKSIVILICLGLFISHGSAADEDVVARVTGQRVNLRAKADLQSEVVGQVGEGDEIKVLSSQGEWAEVLPPEKIDLWIHRDFVSDGQVVGQNLNVRAGAGINYSVVGKLSKGEPVEIRGTFGEWVKISPPPRSSLWVNRDLIEWPKPELKTEMPPAPVVSLETTRLDTVNQSTNVPVELAVKPVETNAPPQEISRPVAPPPDLKLIPLKGQGDTVKREGELKPAAFVFGRPSPFRLVQREGNSISTICYVRGNVAQLNRLLGETLVIHGREYWIQGVRQPLVVVVSIERHARP